MENISENYKLAIMKELSIEEKARAYDEALEKARQLCTYPTSKPFISDLQDLFPELAESDGERIRKTLITGFNKFNESGVWYNGITNGQILAWLEKQGEQNLANSAKTCKDAWSEEDEKGLGDALWCCKQAASIAKDENDMGNAWYAENWLKSLKDRVQLQPQQEWSEKDEAVLDALIRRFKGDDIYVSPHLAIECLKSLRPQSQWKPSDEQIMVLAKASETYCDRDKNTLYSLYNDLKKGKYDVCIGIPVTGCSSGGSVGGEGVPPAEVAKGSHGGGCCEQQVFPQPYGEGDYCAEQPESGGGGESPRAQGDAKEPSHRAPAGRGCVERWGHELSVPALPAEDADRVQSGRS